MIRALVLGLVVCAGAVAGAPATEGDPDVRDLRDALVLIRCGSDGGSGVGVRDDGDTTVVVTCWHVVQGGAEVKVRAPRRTLAAEVVAKDEAGDVALLRVRGRVPVVPLADGALAKGDSLTMIGGASLVSDGSLVSVDEANGRPSANVDMDGYSGDSGGGVFRRGRLVGVVRGVARDTGYACVSLGVRSLLQKVPRPATIAPRTLAPTEGGRWTGAK